jgi:hypothetical protein
LDENFKSRTMVKSTVVITLGKGRLGSRLGKVHGSDDNEVSTDRREKNTGLLSSAMKKALGVQKVGKPAKQSPLRSISARLGPVGGISTKANKLVVQSTSSSEGIFGAERPSFRAPVSSRVERSNEEDEGKVVFPIKLINNDD